MRFLSTKIHAALDYASGLALIALPWIFSFNDVVAATWIVITVGIMILTLSLFTNYEGGIMAAVPMRIHLAIDTVTGIFVACSPWIFGFTDQVYLPHLIFGIFQTIVSILTSHESKAAISLDTDGQKVV